MSELFASPVVDTQSPQAAILVVEDDESIALILKDLLTFETPYHISLAYNSFEAMKALEEIDPKLFIMNYNLPGMNGLALYDRLHAVKGLEQVPMILMSAALPHEIMDEVKRRKIVFIDKPFDLADVLRAVNKLIA